LIFDLTLNLRMKHSYIRNFFIAFSLFLCQSPLLAQLCDSTVPVFPIDFTGHPDTTWTIANITRDGLCCTATNPNRCIEFIITMDVNQQGISLNSSGGPALGAGGIQLECDTTVYSFLDTICLSGIGPHHITLCKPGGNAYDYFITSIPAPNVGPPIAVSDGCTGNIYSSGFIESSITWTSISPGPIGTYNTYLSCLNGCDTTIVTAQPGYPDSVLYQVTGTPRGGCSALTVSRSVWVYFVTDKTASISPQNPVICAGSTSAVLTAVGTGGRPPYNYLWSTGATTSVISVGVGSYWVRIGDNTTCPPVFDTVTVNSRPNPVTDFSSNNPCVNSGMSFIDGSSISSGTVTNWSWNFGDGNTSTLQNPVHPYSTATNYSVTLISFSQSGCSDTIVKVVSVNPTPVANFTANTSCYIDSVRFTNNSTISSGSISSWNWYFGDGNNGSQQNPAHFYSSAGNQTITLVAGSTLGCFDSSTVILNIQPKPAADYSYTPACTNSPILFTDASTIPAGSITGWSWNFGDSNSSNLQNPAHSYTSSNSFSATLIISSAGGCLDTISKTVTVTPNPTTAFTASAMCYTDSVRFINSSSITSGTITSWNWDFGDGNSGTIQNPGHFYTTAGNHTISLVATSNNGCKDTTTVSVNVQPKPTADFISSSGCTDMMIPFTDASTIPAGSITSWNWNFGDSNSSSSQNPSHVYSSSNSFATTLIITSAGGCSDTITKNVDINQSPVAAFLSSGPCFVDSVQFINNSTISSGTISSLQWDFGDGNTGSQQNPNHFYASGGNYNVSLIATSGLGCKDTMVQALSLYFVEAGFSNDGPACQGVAVNFTDTSYSDTTTTITSWSWDFGDGGTSFIQNPSHPYSAGGSYTVQLIVTTAAGCMDTVTQVVNIQGLPVANAGVDTSSCSNNPALNLNGLVMNAGGGIWSGSGTFSPGATTLNSIYTPSASAVSNGSETLILTTTSNALCPAAIDSVIITFTPAPTVNAGSDLTVCKDTTNVPVCAIVTVGSGALWQTSGSGTFVNDSSACTQYIPSSADTTAGSVTLYVTSTGNGTCFAASDTIIINFTNTPTAFITSGTVFCASNPVGLSVNTTTGAGVWSSPGTGTFSPNNSTLNAIYHPSAADDAAGNVTLYFTSTNNGGCKARHDTINVTLIPSPNGAFTNIPACPSLPVLFTDASTSTGSVVSWNWNFGDGSTTSTSQNPTHIYNAGGPYTVSLIVTSNNGCVDTVKDIVSVFYKPVAEFNAEGSCLNEGVQFTDASTVQASTITSWNWNFGDASISDIQNPVHFYSSGNTYSTGLIVESAQGCKDTVVHSITMFSGPFAGFTSDDPSAIVGQSVNFTDHTTNGAVSWFWDFGDSALDSTSTAQNPSHVYMTTGFFDVCLYATDINGCTDTICKQEIVSLPPTIPSGFSPNGDGENDVLYVYGGPFKVLEFKIYNNWGELIYTSDKQSEGWDGKRKGIDQPIGVYVYTVHGVTENDEEYHLSGM
jgi:gliding motility-associated-like protein